MIPRTTKTVLSLDSQRKLSTFFFFFFLSAVCFLEHLQGSNGLRKCVLKSVGVALLSLRDGIWKKEKQRESNRSHCDLQLMLHTTVCRSLLFTSLFKVPCLRTFKCMTVWGNFIYFRWLFWSSAVLKVTRSGCHSVRQVQLCSLSPPCTSNSCTMHAWFLCLFLCRSGISSLACSDLDGSVLRLKPQGRTSSFLKK